MKYVREKDGKIEIMEDRDSISAGAETIFSTEPAVYEGTWDNGVENLEGDVGGKVFGADVFKKHGDILMKGEQMEVQNKTYPGDIPRDTSFIGTKEERAKLKYDPEQTLAKHQRMTGWKGVHKSHPQDKICLECGKPMPGARPNKKFCSDKCRDAHKKRAQRAKASAIKKFVPHKGNEGQVYYILDGKIDFIPSLWCDSLKRAEKYVKTNYPANVQDVVLEQLREVMGQ